MRDRPRAKAFDRRVSFGGLSGGPGYIPQTEALISAMSTKPDVTRTALIDALVRGLIADGIWQKLDLLYILAAHDEQAGRVNWVNPGRMTAVATNSPTFTTDRGYQSDGATSRLTLNFIASSAGVNYVQDNASLWAWSLTDGQSASGDAGAATGGNANRLLLRNASDLAVVAVNSTTTDTVASADGRGFFGASRADNATVKVWRNGAQLGGDVTRASSGLSNVTSWLLGLNSGVFSSRQQAAGAWGASLTGLESAFYSRLLTYMQAVGAVA